MRQPLLFSPSSRYPNPAAYLVDDAGTILHTWTHPAGQPDPADNPPNYLRGWNHVEADTAGNLLAIVPLRSLLKLTPGSELVWSCDITAHHDIAAAPGETILVLTETPRVIESAGHPHVVLDNLVTKIDRDGAIVEEHSLYDILRSDSRLRSLLDDHIWQRSTEFRESSWYEPLTAGHSADPRRKLQFLRALPGKPCDVMHTNTLERTGCPPHRLWDEGDVLVCMREIDTIAVLDLERSLVRWWWGPGHLSGPHQPSVLPDGRVVVFDNGVRHHRTRIIVVDPATGMIAWNWQADPPESFYCPLAGGCERLANGNLLVTSPRDGEAFELTMDGDIVWRLRLPPAVYGQDRDRVSIYRMSAATFDPRRSP